jgi:hypothetical protein
MSVGNRLAVSPVCGAIVGNREQSSAQRWERRTALKDRGVLLEIGTHAGPWPSKFEDILSEKNRFRFPL